MLFCFELSKINLRTFTTGEAVNTRKLKALFVPSSSACFLYMKVSEERSIWLLVLVWDRGPSKMQNHFLGSNPAKSNSAQADLKL